MRFLCLLLLGMMSMGVVAAQPRPVMVLGDSLAAAHNIAVEQGWVHLLEVRLSEMRPPRPLINASISGETSLSGRNRLPALLQHHRPALLVLELGANDGLRGLPLVQIRTNLAAMLDECKAAGVPVLLVGIEMPVNYGPHYRDGLRAVYADLAAQYGTGLVPFLLEGVALQPELMQADGMHPTAAGEPRVFDNVWKALAPMLQALPAT
jgi:acyl-CoA thioesterase-1